MDLMKKYIRVGVDVTKSWTQVIPEASSIPEFPAKLATLPKPTSWVWFIHTVTQPITGTMTYLNSAKQKKNIP